MTPFAAFLDERRTGANRHPLADLGGAGNRRTRAPGDLRAAIGAQHGLALGRHLGHAQLNEAHAAVSGRAKLGMVTIVRNEVPALHAGFDEPRALGELLPFPVHLHI